MALPTTTQLQELLDQLANSWSAGNGREFGASFIDNAHFVAFDGTLLEGPQRSGNTIKPQSGRPAWFHAHQIWSWQLGWRLAMRERLKSNRQAVE
jgi:hypothetical protein